MEDLIRRQDVINLLDEWGGGFKYIEVETDGAIDAIMDLPTAPPERLTNKEWIDFLITQFDVSRTSAKEMLHGMMKCKTEDNFKKQFSGGDS